MKKFAFLFVLGNRIAWSGEDEKTLPRRANGNLERDKIKTFIANADVGGFMKLEPYGEFIFRTE